MSLDDEALIAPYFDATYYITKYPDIALAGANPLQHYLEQGWREGRDPSAIFDANYYVGRYGSMIGEQCPLVHYAAIGKDNGFVPNHLSNLGKIFEYVGPIREMMARSGVDPETIQDGVIYNIVIPMFSAKVIRERHALPESVSDFECFIHYLLFDFSSGRRPGFLFDGRYYAEKAKDKGLSPPIDPMSSFLHWLTLGVKNKICPIAWYRDEDYILLNPDLRHWPEWPFLHFIQHGLKEGRRFHPVLTISHVNHAGERPGSLMQGFLGHLGERPEIGEGLDQVLKFWRSLKMKEIMARGIALEPQINVVEEKDPSYVAPLHDDGYHSFDLIRRLLPDRCDNIIVTPFCKLGGADFVSGVLARSLAPSGKLILLRTDQSDWARPDWFPAQMETFDLSVALKPLHLELRKRILYKVIRHLRTKERLQRQQPARV